MNDTQVVYSTATGAPPRARPTDEATVVPPPVKRIAKRTVKKHRPRVRVQSTELTHVKVDPRVWAKARSILAEGRYQRIEVIDSETVIVR